MPITTIVVPCHDEARRLNVAAFRQFVRGRSDVKLLLVNDGSHDNTLAILQELAATDPLHFQVLHLAQNGGKAEAVRHGVLHAMREQPDYIGYWDADLATPLEVIPQFAAVLDRRPQLTLVMGVRVPLLGHDIRRRPLRRWLGKRFAQVTSLALGLRSHDTQCGAKLFRATPEMAAAFSRPFSSRWIFDVELLARCIRLRRGTSQPSVAESIYEFALDYWEDVAGSKLKRGDFIKAARELTTIWWRYLRPGAPPYLGLPLSSDNSIEVQPAQPRRAA